MVHKILSIFLLITAALLRNVDSIHPDISFTGDNDRFDLSSMMNAHKREAPGAEDSESESEAASDDDYRRQLRTRDTEIPELSDEPKKSPLSIIRTRRAESDGEAMEGNFGEDDRMNSDEGGTVSDFNENLKKFQLKYMKPASRRNMPEDDAQVAKNEIFMKNAFPIVMTVDGYLKAPVE